MMGDTDRKGRGRHLEKNKAFYGHAEEKICGGIRLYAHYISVILRSAMEYKVSFLLAAVGQLFVSFQGLLGIYFIFGRFPAIKGYTYGEALLCYGAMLLGFSIAQCFARGFESFSQFVKSGEFDRMLVRPRSTVLQVLGSRFEANRVFRILLAGGMFSYGAGHCQIAWTAGRAAVAAFMVFGVVMLFAGLFLLGASISFFTVEDGGFLNVLIYGGSEHGKYPIDIYGKRMLKFCTYGIPYALVQYYPLQYLLGHTERWEYGLCPFGAMMFLLACYAAWRFGVRHYHSAGS